MSINHLYSLLEVTPTDTLGTIKKAYHRLAKQSHPDRRPGTHTQHFLHIQQAWDTLSDPTLRNAYDAEQTRLHIDAVLQQDTDTNTEDGDALTLNYDTLELQEDFVYDQNEEAHISHCRCGETLYVEPEDIEDAQETSQNPYVDMVCTGCSISYRVALAVPIPEALTPEALTPQEEKLQQRTSPAPPAPT